MRTKGSHNTAPREPRAPSVPTKPANPLPSRKFALKASASATSDLTSALARHMRTPQTPGANRKS